MSETSVKYQYFAAAVVNLLSMSNGVSYGWISPNLLLLKSDETPLPSGKINMEQGSWIASFLCIGALVGNLCAGFITNKFGRKNPLLGLAIPTIMSWLLIIFAENVYYLYAARMLIGFVGGGLYVIMPMFLSEIASDRVRGTLGSTLALNVHSGTLLAFVVGNYCDYYTTPMLSIALITVFAILFYFFPESPTFLVKQNRISDAENAIRFYQNLGKKEGDCGSVQDEINKLKSAFNSTHTEKYTMEHTLKWSDFTTKTARRAMTIGVVLVTVNQFSGCFAMMNYTATIFEESGSNFSPNMSAIVVGAVQLIGAVVSVNFVDRAGRKFLLSISCIGTALGMACFGIYTMLKENGYDMSAFSWFPIAIFAFMIFIAACGILTLPFLVITEIMPEKLKNFGTSFCMELLWLFTFIMLKCLPLLTDTLGMHGSMFLFATVCLLSAIFILLFVPETKGRSYDEIMKSLC